jgi:hypothetical protein
MTSGRCSTSHPFAVAICGSCAAEPAAQLLQMLRASIRRCPHAMLVTTGCLLGQLTCATRPPLEGVILLLQPCSTQRIPEIFSIPVDRQCGAASDPVVCGSDMRLRA